MVFIRKYFVHTFAALQHPNYRLWFYGQLISLTGTWMQATAQGFLVYLLTNSTTYLGMVSFANGIPSWLFMLYGGVVADRMPRRKLLIFTQTAMMILAFMLAFLVFSNLVQAWHIVVLSFLLGVANAFDAPTRLAFVSELVDRETLTNAIALNSTMFNGAAIVGPSVAGMIYAWFGAGWCFIFNGLSFVAVIIALTLMKINEEEYQPKKHSAVAQVKEGLKYVIHNDTIKTMLVILAFVSFFAAGMVALIPAWTVQALKGDAQMNGLILSTRGIGAVLGALIIATFAHKQIKGKLLLIGITILPISVILFTLSNNAFSSLVIMILIGIGFMLAVNSSNSIVQATTQDQLRGRVMSIFTLVFFGFMPLGSLFLGFLADVWSIHNAFFFCSAMLLILSCSIWLVRPLLRNIP